MSVRMNPHPLSFRFWEGPCAVFQHVDPKSYININFYRLRAEAEARNAENQVCGPDKILFSILRVMHFRKFYNVIFASC